MSQTLNLGMYFGDSIVAYVRENWYDMHHFSINTDHLPFRVGITMSFCAQQTALHGS